MKRRLMTLVSAAAAAFAIAGISAAWGSSAYSAAGYGAPAAASATTPAAIGVGQTSVGRVIVDGKGRTLYLFDKDTSRRSACSSLCARYWPPLLTHGAPVARAGTKQSLLGQIRRTDGSRQVTYGGHPLYRYAEDDKPGQTHGEGSVEFGAEWDVVSANGKKL